MKRLLSRFIGEEDGQGMTEYALIIGLIVVVILASVIVFRDKIIDLIKNASETIGG